VAFDDLYQEIILDHYRNPRNAATLDDVPDEMVHENPSCGDSVKLRVHVNDDGIVDQVLFDGKGCAISTASASIMTEEVIGKPVAEVRDLIWRFVSIMRGQSDVDGLDDLGDLTCLRGVISFPLRVKCATLAWHALESALPAE
jgi:nitrogen fixation NifU-like protein